MPASLPLPKDRFLYLPEQVNQESMNKLTKSIVDINADDAHLKKLYAVHGLDYTPQPIKIYIDSYGNVITNITKSLFQQVRKGRSFTILFRSSAYAITKISRKYSQVPEGEKIALFGSSEHLEIAINKGVEGAGGGANKLFGLKIYDTVTIEFD